MSNDIAVCAVCGATKEKVFELGIPYGWYFTIFDGVSYYLCGSECHQKLKAKNGE